MWQGIVIGMVFMVLINFIIRTLAIPQDREHYIEMRDLMIEGNRLRFERNKILDRIAGMMGAYEGIK